MNYNGFSIDIEANGFVFEASKIWVICLEDLDSGEKLKLHPFKDVKAKQKFINWLSKYENPNICFHNGLGYDIFVLMFVLGIEYSVGPDTIEGIAVQFVDTFYLSMYLNPDRGQHSIEYWGEELRMPKIDFRTKLIEIGALEKSSPEGQEFLTYHKLMDDYCERDTLVGKMTFIALIEEWSKLYKSWNCSSWPEHFKAGQKAFYLMSCQELSGWKFDVEAAKKLSQKIDQMMEDIRAEVEPELPPRSLKKSEEKEYSMPAKPFKKDGSLSSTMEKWIEKHNAKYMAGDFVEAYGKVYKIEANKMLDIKLPMEMANQDQMKDWFLSSGWEPTLFNYKRGSDGKPVRDPNTRQLITTSPKIQEAGKLCPNLEKMEGDLVKKVVKWLSLRNRQSVLNGWLENDRLGYDGRIGAGRTGIAATHRQKHKVVVNVPKADPKVLLGYEFRELWIAEEGMLIAAGDAAALEGRVQGHYAYRYDNGATADELLKGDVHSKNANAFYGSIYPEVSELYTSPDFDKENPKWKPYRNKSKNGFYAILYGAAAPKVASTLGIPEKFGKEALEAFWEANPGTKQLKENLEEYWQTTGKSKYLPAIDGRILMTRKKSALLNTIFQSCGGIVMDYAGCFMDRWLGEMYWDDKRRPYYLFKGCIVRRIGYFHDELEFECEEAVAEDVAKLIEKSIAKAGEYLKVKVPLVGEGKVGKNWKEVH
jgi:hypothetical protein